MQQRKLGPQLSVSALGFGCMGMTYAYGGQDEQDAIRTLHRAVDLGVTFSIRRRSMARSRTRNSSARR